MIDIVVPRPIAWVSTCDRQGRDNLAPFSYFTAVSSDPACIMFSISRKRGGVPKDTLNNIKQTQQFVVNTVPKRLDQLMVNTSREFDTGVSEFTECRVESAPSNWVKPPRVAGCCSALECRLFDLLPIKNEKGRTSATMVIGRVLGVYFNPEFYDAELNPLETCQPVARLGSRNYLTWGKVYKMQSEMPSLD